MTLALRRNRDFVDFRTPPPSSHADHARDRPANVPQHTQPSQAHIHGGRGAFAGGGLSVCGRLGYSVRWRYRLPGRTGGIGLPGRHVACEHGIGTSVPLTLHSMLSTARREVRDSQRRPVRWRDGAARRHTKGHPHWRRADELPRAADSRQGDLLIVGDLHIVQGRLLFARRN